MLPRGVGACLAALLPGQQKPSTSSLELHLPRLPMATAEKELLCQRRQEVRLREHPFTAHSLLPVTDLSDQLGFTPCSHP